MCGIRIMSPSSCLHLMTRVNRYCTGRLRGEPGQHGRTQAHGSHRQVKRHLHSFRAQRKSFLHVGPFSHTGQLGGSFADS